MPTGENQAFRWAAREGEPVPLTPYRVMRRVEWLTPKQAIRVAEGLGALSELLETAGATGMSTHAAVAAGLITEADYWRVRHDAA